MSFRLNRTSIRNRLKYALAYLQEEWSYYRPVSVDRQLAKMRSDWDRRAQENARYYVSTAKESWDDDEFYASGEQELENYILSDMGRICQGKEPKSLKVLEIGCGSGRVTRPLARIFGEVHGVDISADMVRLAGEAVKPFSNSFVYQNNGFDLSVIPTSNFDFAFSHLVFQHVPNRRIVENYIREANRLLRPGGLFKFQVQGDVSIRSKPNDTWIGVTFSDRQIVRLARQHGFDPRYREGAGQQDFWIWCYKCR